MVFLLLILLNFPCIAAQLSLEEKVGQMMMPFFHGQDVNEDARILIRDLHVGGIIYYQWANGLTDPEQVKLLSSNLQNEVAQTKHKIPLLIAVDQEGGVVNRLKNGFTLFPGNPELAKKTTDQVHRLAYQMGKELSGVGVNLNLAPVVDVLPNESSASTMRNRSFGSSAQWVAKYGKCVLQGLHEAGVIAALKHFPGYGSAVTDPHLGLPIVNLSKEEIEKKDLLPFKLLANDAEVIMTAHILMPAIDAHHCATLSSKLIEGILRKEFGFKGVIISDSLVMQGVLDACNNDLAEVAIQTILSGHDILLFGGKMLGQKNQKELTVDDIKLLHQKIVQAVKQGVIPLHRIDESVNRILRLKKKGSLTRLQ